MRMVGKFLLKALARIGMLVAGVILLFVLCGAWHEINMTRTEEWNYDKNAQGTITVTKYKGDDEHVVIPAELDGLPVTRLEMIGMFDVFRYDGYPAVREITLPATMTENVDDALYYFRHLENVYVAEGNPACASCDGVLCTVDGATMLRLPGLRTEWEAPEGTLVIGDGFAGGHKHLQRVVLCEGVTTIETFAFVQCDNLVEAVVPASVVSIGEYAFAQCPQLTMVVVEGSVAHSYAVENGIPCRLAE